MRKFAKKFGKLPGFNNEGDMGVRVRACVCTRGRAWACVGVSVLACACVCKKCACVSCSAEGAQNKLSKLSNLFCLPCPDAFKKGFAYF